MRERVLETGSTVHPQISLVISESREWDAFEPGDCDTVTLRVDAQTVDGVLDPLRSASDRGAVELAASMLVSIDPWGRDKARYERELLIALAYGVSQGADCIGQALLSAYHAGKASQALIRPIWELAEASPMFRAGVGGTRLGGEVLTFGVANADQTPKGDSHGA